MKTERGRGELGEIQTTRKRIGEKMGKDGEEEKKGKKKDGKGIRSVENGRGKCRKRNG